MASVYITHRKYPKNPQLFTVNLHKVAGIAPEANPNFTPSFGVGERFWKLFIYTSGLDASGDLVGPIVADVIATEDTVDDFVSAKIAELCDLIDWSQQGQFSPESDAAAPVVVEQYPQAGQAGVSITSPVMIRVQDIAPAVGVDPSTVSLTIDGYDVAPHVSGNKYDQVFTFSPKPIFDS